MPRILPRALAIASSESNALDAVAHTDGDGVRNDVSRFRFARSCLRQAPHAPTSTREMPFWRGWGCEPAVVRWCRSVARRQRQLRDGQRLAGWAVSVWTVRRSLCWTGSDNEASVGVRLSSFNASTV